MMNVLITGADGFIGKNLLVRLRELSEFEISIFVRGDTEQDLRNKLCSADVVIHLAGENRPASEDGFHKGNVELTNRLCSLLSDFEKRIPLILTSSVQARLDNPYGISKLNAERCVVRLSDSHGNPVVIYRLPGVFGKWCRPNYNSVVATFCNNVANDLPVEIHDSTQALNLVYIDDVVSSLINVLRNKFSSGVIKSEILPEYSITLGNLAATLKKFKKSRSTLISERVGTDFLRALYATYISYLPKDSFTYPLVGHADERGKFVEILKTSDSGQFSFFTAQPGITRGGHYHHTKSEKFLVVKGNAEFELKHIVSGEKYKIQSSDKELCIVESIPGWAHSITNIGDEEMIVMLWANEIFDRDKPDTIGFIM